MSKQIIKWCDAICHNEDEMHLGSYKTFKMIKDEAQQLSQQIQHLEQQLQQAHRAAEESAKDAHRRGWEQAKAEADNLLLDLLDVVLESKPVVQSARRAIAALEYKEPTNDR